MMAAGADSPGATGVNITQAAGLARPRRETRQAKPLTSHYT